MEVKAKAKHIKTSPRKIRLVIDAVRGLKTDKALDQLKFMNKLATKPVSKLIKSGIANAINNYELEEDNLYIKEIKADDGPTLKRWQPRAHGRATTIRKRTSHVNLILAEIKDSGLKKSKSTKLAAPIKLGAKAKEDEGVKGKSKEAKDKDIKKKDATKEVDQKIVDPRMEGRGGHTKVEGGSKKGFGSRIFRRKSG